MRQTLLLNLVVLGFFVFLFSALYRKCPTERVKFWIVGWVWAVLHFAVSFANPASDLGGAIVDALSVSCLFLCGVSFLISVPVHGEQGRRFTGGIIAALLVLFCFVSEIAPGARHSLLLIDLVAQITALVVLWRYHIERMTLKIPGTALLLICSQWTAYFILRGQMESATYIQLMELFAAYALLFAQKYGRRTAGVSTTIIGLVMWAGIFLAANYVEVLWPRLAVNPEIWNVPKVVVAFGMLVTLLEDEQAGAAREREQYRNLFRYNPLPMWIFQPNSMQLLEANAAAIRTFGWDHDQLRDLTLNDLLSENEPSPVGLVELNWRLAGEEDAGDSTKYTEVTRADAIRFRTRHGSDVIVEATLQRISFQGHPARLLMAKDITSQVQLQQQLIHQANHDPLTGLPNRLLLQDRMTGALATAARRGKKAAVICIDLDRFKQINDTFGHAAGDSCLREVATRLSQRLRAIDTAARTGGEEFMILLDDVSSVQDAERVAVDVLGCLVAPHVFEGIQLKLSASLGIALYPDDGLDPAALWSMADAAMYRAKQSGGNRYLFFSHTH